MTDIAAIVAPLALRAEEQTEWPPLRLRVRTYLTSTLPPLDLISSVRALVVRGEQVLIVRDPVYDAQRREVDGYELEAGFQLRATVAGLPISEGERALLRAALEV